MASLFLQVGSRSDMRGLIMKMGGAVGIFLVMFWVFAVVGVDAVVVAMFLTETH